MKNAPTAAKLSKRFLLELAQDASLLSNIMPAPDHPILDSTLTHFFQRLTQSQAIVDARTKDRIWPAFRNTADYLTMSLDVPCRRERN